MDIHRETVSGLNNIMQFKRHNTRQWLIGILIFLPFQHNIYTVTLLWNADIALFLNRIEELTVVIFFPLALIKLYENKELLTWRYLMLFIPLLSLILVGLISGIVNGSSLIVTLHGTFDYVKYFFVIFLYAAFFREFKDFERMFKILLIVTVFLGLIAFIQEAWAITYRYIFSQPVSEIFKPELISIILGKQAGDSSSPWRIGIYRTSSLMVNGNFLGLYCLLTLVVYVHVIERLKLSKLFFIVFGIVGSVSRVVYVSFALFAIVQVLKGKKRWLAAFISISILLCYLSPLPEYFISKFQSKKLFTTYNRVTTTEYINKEGWDYIRTYTREKAIEIWKDHVFLGAGPGMYGGPISLKYKSPIYERYNFTPDRILSLNRIESIDQFWLQVLAELGVAGIIGMLWLFLSLFLVLYRLKSGSDDIRIRMLYDSLFIYLFILLIYSIGFSLNLIPIIFTFFALVGISLGIEDRNQEVG